MMNKTELRNATSAANKIIKLTSKVRKDCAGCFYDKQGRQIIISNCIAIRLNEHLPVSEASIPFGSVDNLFLSACQNTEQLDLLSLEYLKDYIQHSKDYKPDYKNYIQDAKEYAIRRARRYKYIQSKSGGRKFVIYDFGERLPMVNSEYMLLIYKVLGWQNLTAKINEDKWETSPIYFSSDRGDGILMPIKKKECVKWTR